MLEELNKLLKEIRDTLKLKRLELSENPVSEEGVKCLPISSEYFLLVDSSASYKEIFHIKNLIEEILKLKRECNLLSTELHLLKTELKLILKSNEVYFSPIGEIGDFFKFLSGNKFAVVENGKVVINTGIDRYTLEVTLLKLKKKKEVELPVGYETLYAISVGVYQAIVLGKLDNLLKNVLKSRLLWLTKLFYEREKYSVDILTGAYTLERLSVDLKSFKYLVLINIKNTGTINEIFGVKFGNSFLKEFTRLLTNFRCNETYAPTVYRIRGDKFAVSLNQDCVRKLLNFLKEKELRVYHHLRGTFIKIKPQVNLILIREPSLEKVESSINAFKLDKVKNKEITYYEEIEDILDAERKAISLTLYAIERDKTVPVFQKIEPVRKGLSPIFEVLMRIERGGKLLPPSQFLETAVKYGLYLSLNKSIALKGVELVKDFNKEISLNLCQIDFQDGWIFDFIEKLPETIRKKVVLEFTENTFISIEKEKLENIKYLGVKIAIDDFGTGYSNFSYLFKFPVDIVKFDGSLIDEAYRNESLRRKLKSLVKFSKDLGTYTVAEYVANEELYKFCIESGFDYLQGFFIAKPKTREEVEENC